MSNMERNFDLKNIVSLYPSGRTRPRFTHPDTSSHSPRWMLWRDLLLILQTITAFLDTDKLIKVISKKLRNRHLFFLDIIILSFTPAVALTLRLDGLRWWPEAIQALILFTGVSLLVKISIFYGLGLYGRYWRYAGVNDLMRLLLGVALAALLLSLIFIQANSTLASYHLAMYRAIPLIDGLLTCMAVCGLRLGVRTMYFWYRQHVPVVGGQRVLIVGAGEAGTMVVREARANPQLNLQPVAFVDDDPFKIGAHIHGLPVLGAIAQVQEMVDTYQIQRIIVAIPSAPLGTQKAIIDLCQKTGVATDNLPGMYELMAGSKTISPLTLFDINQLLHRDPVRTDQAEVAADLKGATVLVTGAGGSIGSELCRQIARFEPAELILLGHGENSIFEIGLELSIAYPRLITRQVIVDIRDQKRIHQVIKKYQPDVIFHAAAHKHVPFMEDNVGEAITNNILGTQNVLQAAEKYGVRRFILISSDKAVNPTSTMGATKRMAELLVVATARRSKMAYMAVRFGNVLGSRGSVVPIFQRQIAAGGPLTITHPDMRRYFMTIPEAVQLVLQAVVLGQGGEVFVLDMGQPVRILDLALDLIKMSGLEPERDIKIIYKGIRPGEKLSEELFLDTEEYQRTKHPKVFMANLESTIEPELLEQIVTELAHLSRQIPAKAAAEHMRILLPKMCYYIDRYTPQSQPSLLLKPTLMKPEPAVAGGLLYPQPS